MRPGMYGDLQEQLAIVQGLQGKALLGHILQGYQVVPATHSVCTGVGGKEVLEEVKMGIISPRKRQSQVQFSGSICCSTAQWCCISV